MKNTKTTSENRTGLFIVSTDASPDKPTPPAQAARPTGIERPEPQQLAYLDFLFSIFKEKADRQEADAMREGLRAWVQDIAVLMPEDRPDVNSFGSFLAEIERAA